MQAPASVHAGAAFAASPRDQPGARRRGAPVAREALLHRLWREQRLAARPLPADDGGTYQVVFPGWPNGDHGPDFRQAILADRNGRLLRGDVEIHVHARDWRLHGHDRNPAYNEVVLHVAWRGGREGTTRTLNGKAVPSVTLEGLLELPIEALLLAGHAPAKDPRPCVRHGAPDLESIGAVLEQEGKRRFLGKAAALAGDAAVMGPEQALYRGLLEALGYSRNRQPFQELAERAPWETLAGLVAGKAPHERRPLLEALLFGHSGLLPSQRESVKEADPDVRELERLWSRYGGGKVHAPGWQHFRVRPENAPLRRVAAAAALVERFLPIGLLAGLAGQLESDDPSAAGLRESLTVTRDGYWARHLDFGRASGLNPTLVGKGRASDMVVNVVLPFFHSWAEERRDTWLRNRCLELYRAHPPLSENRIIREMERMLVPDGAGKVATTAIQQQGLIGLYKRRCKGLLCQGCAFEG